MGVFKVPITKENEIIKSSDFNDGSDYEITNIVSALKALLSSENKSFVIGGEVKPYNAGSGSSGLNVTVSPAFIYCGETEEGIIIDEETSGNTLIPLGSVPKNGAYFTLGVKCESEVYDKQARMFNDPSVDAKVQDNMETKKKIIPEFMVWQGDDGSSVAPSVDKGYVKLAEIHLSGGQDDVTENDIHNITARKPGDENESWVSDKSATYNPTYLAELFGKFLVEHNEDGSHKDQVIKDNNILLGTGSGAVNLQDMQVAQNINIKHTSLGSPTMSGTDAIAALADEITALYLYADGVLRRFTLDSSIKAVSDGNLSSLKNISKIDGVSLEEGNIVLLKDQSDKKENGLYVLDSDGNLSRAQGYTTGTSLSNRLFYSRYGTKNQGKMFYVIDADDSIGTDEIEFGEAFLSPFAIAGTVVMRDENGRFKAAAPSDADDVAIYDNVLTLQSDNNNLQKEIDNNYDDLLQKIKDEESERKESDTTLQNNIDKLSETVTANDSKVEGYYKELKNKDSDLQDQIDNIHVKVLLSEPYPIEKGDIWLV